jgi:type I restriction enzyme S subunit
MSFPRYERYKDSGVEWLGAVPDHWEVMRLKRDLDFITSGSRGWADHYSADGELFIRIGNLTKDSIRLDLSDVQRVSVPVGTEGERTRVRSGDLLFSITAYLGSIAVVPENIESAYVSQHVALVRLKGQRLLPQWAAYVALSKVGKTYLETQGYGGTKIQLSLDDVANLVMPVPDKAEQSAIVTFIDREVSKIDDLIAEQERLIDLLQQKRQAIVSDAVTRGVNLAVPKRKSGVEWFGEVPRHWEVIRLGALFKEAADIGSDELPVLSVSIHDGVSDREFDDEELDRKVTRSEDRTKYKSVQPGDLVYNMMRAWQGGFGTVAVHGMVSPAYVVARPVTAFCTQFVEHLLRTPHAVEELRRHSHGVTDFRLRLYWDAFKSIKIVLPPPGEQEQILDYLKRETAKYDALTSEAQAGITLLEERRISLISAAVTGKIDVCGSTKPKPEKEADAA